MRSTMMKSFRNFILIFVLLFASSSYGFNNKIAFFQVISKTLDCTISTVISGWRSNAAETINFTCTNNYLLNAPECQVDGGAWTACTTGTSHSISGIADGDSKTFSVRVRDYYNKYSVVDVNASRAWQKDGSAPTVSLGAISGTNTGSPSIAFTVTEPHSSATSECSYDTGTASYSACTSPRAGTTNTAGATYFFRVRATNSAGVVSTVASTTWTNANWSAFGACSAPCGGGTQSRTCTNPSASVTPAGMPCSGVSSQACNTAPCCTNADLTTNMCANRLYYPYTFGNPISCTPGTFTANVNTNVTFLCTAPDCTTTLPDGTTNSCRNGSATQIAMVDYGKGSMVLTCRCN